MAGDPTLRTVFGIAANEYFDAVLGPLHDYNVTQAGDGRWEPFAVLVEDPSTGAITGGLYGQAIYGWVFVKLLVVPEAHRGRGIGSRLMAEAEAFARDRGCAGVWLDTYEFQARGFYEKLGYRLFGVLEGGGGASEQYFLKKRFV